MKKVFTFLLMSLLLTACETTQKPDGYVINGTAKGVINGIRVYLKTKDNRGKELVKDTAIVIDEKFKFEGKVNRPQVWFLHVNSVNGNRPFMIENDYIDVEIEKDSIHATKVTGTKSNEVFNIYSNTVKELSNERRKLNMEFKIADQTSDTEKAKELQAKIVKNNHDMANLPFELISEHNDNNFVLILIESLISSNNTDLNKLIESYNTLSSEIKGSDFGKTIQNKIEALKKEKERLANLEIGKAAPEFSAPDPDGKMLALKDMRGKVTIIDFWASWCGPCRRENPNVVKVYEKYHDKGLEIIGVSLDKQGQKDRWLSAIEKDKLTWHHVSNLAYFNDPVAKQYAINSIPATYILDEEGTIIAKNLRGPALENKIAELLD